MKVATKRFGVLVMVNVLAWCAVGAIPLVFAQQQKGGQLPFANSNEQRSDILREIQEIKSLLKEQNALLQEGASKNAAPKR